MNTKLAFSQIHTPCADCVFCKNEIQDGKKIQTGCKLNKIEQYEAAGVDVANCYDENENELGSDQLETIIFLQVGGERMRLLRR